MKRAPRRVISIVALGAALLTGCESDYQELSDDLLESGWGEDAAIMLPVCPRMDATIPVPEAGASDAGSDAATQDGGGDAGASSDAGSADGSADSDGSAGDAASDDAG